MLSLFYSSIVKYLLKKLRFSLQICEILKCLTRHSMEFNSFVRRNVLKLAWYWFIPLLFEKNFAESVQSGLV